MNKTSSALKELQLFLKRFKNPHDVQLFLNETNYDPEPGTKSPLLVAQNKAANCFEGALFAAAALRTMGYKPFIIDMIAENDDDHVIAIFRKNDHFGAIAKSNTTVLRFREPVYRSVRELVMSYFEMYFNTIGEKTLRSFSNPVNLSKFDKSDWMTTNENLDFIGDYLYTIKHHKILNTKMLRELSPADKTLVDLGFTGSVPEGLFIPETKSKAR
jgi:hypothetical protein